MECKKQPDDVVASLGNEDSEVLSVDGFKELTEQLINRGLRMLDQRKLLKWLMDENPNGVVCHREGKITYINESAWKMLGYADYTEVLGRNIKELLHESEHHMVDAELNAMYQGHSTRGSKKKKLVDNFGNIVNVVVKYHVQEPYDDKKIYQYVIKE